MFDRPCVCTRGSWTDVVFISSIQSNRALMLCCIFVQRRRNRREMTLHCYVQWSARKTCANVVTFTCLGKSTTAAFGWAGEWKVGGWGEGVNFPAEIPVNSAFKTASQKFPVVLVVGKRSWLLCCRWWVVLTQGSTYPLLPTHTPSALYVVASRNSRVVCLVGSFSQSQQKRLNDTFVVNIQSKLRDVYFLCVMIPVGKQTIRLFCEFWPKCLLYEYTFFVFDLCIFTSTVRIRTCTIYTYTCVGICNIEMFVYTSIYACMALYTYMCAYIYTHVCIQVCIPMHTCALVYSHVCKRAIFLYIQVVCSGVHLYTDLCFLRWALFCIVYSGWILYISLSCVDGFYTHSAREFSDYIGNLWLGHLLIYIP